MFKKSLFLLSFLSVVSVGWGQVSEPLQFDFVWSNDADSIQAVLHDAIAFSENVYPEDGERAGEETQIVRRGRKITLTDGKNSITCEAKTIGVAQVMSYRAQVSLGDYSVVTPTRFDLGGWSR